MREAHGRPVLAGKRDPGASDMTSSNSTTTTSSPNSPSIQKSSTGNVRVAPSPHHSSTTSSGSSRESRSHDALISNLENRLLRFGGKYHYLSFDLLL